MMLRQGCFSLATLVFIASLYACSSDGKKWDPEDYTVKSGDTVYSIAWRYELDTEEFAAWNDIPSSKFIKPGQRLHTRKPANFDRAKHEQVEKSVAYVPAQSSTQSAEKNQVYKKWVKAEKGDTLYGISRQYGISIDRLAQLNQLKAPYVITPGQTIFLKPLNSGSSTAVADKPVVQTKSKDKPPVKSTAQSSSPVVSWPKSVRWQKPANGKIVKKYSRWRNDAKGIDIEGRQGNSIVAAADGKVVYSGNGLISYGNLIILKHNKTFLSAYAYNRKLLVKEGEMVKGGQQIAEMGHKDKHSPRLHFEIRKNGKPVDPLKYLPW